MEAVLAAINERKQAFAKLPFFEFLQDESLEPHERLAFYPAMAHWIMSFADLNKYFLRAEATAGDAHQQRVNVYSHEDDDHWRLYVEDFRKLGFHQMLDGADWLGFLWGDETRANRMLSYRLSHLITGATSVQRIAIVEAMEEAANVFFPLTLRLAEQIREETGVELRYLGHFHFNLEAEHTGAGDHDALAQIELDDATRRRTLEMVGEVFDLFEDWADEVLRFAETQLSKRTPMLAPPAAAAAAAAAAATARPEHFIKVSRIM
ncbi:MAG: hypothetical protein QOG71_1999 [Pyrinomonadaceae bacterium]|nr:hypothetical protein [Pyrinomonadaceae bacterium]